MEYNDINNDINIDVLRSSCGSKEIVHVNYLSSDAPSFETYAVDGNYNVWLIKLAFVI